MRWVSKNTIAFATRLVQPTTAETRLHDDRTEYIVFHTDVRSGGYHQAGRIVLERLLVSDVHGTASQPQPEFTNLWEGVTEYFANRWCRG